MSQENVEFVQRVMEQFAATGEPPWELLHENVEVHDHDLMDAGEYRGFAGFARWGQDWTDAWSEYSMEPVEFFDAGERVVAVISVKATGRSSGVEVEREDAMVYAVRDGKVVRLDYYNNREQALEVVGLEE